jgi:hypothetical protein
MLWNPQPPSARALAALKRLALPSVVKPLPGSIGIGINQWLMRSSPSEVESAYRRPGAPIPPGAVVRAQEDGVLLVESPFRTSGIFLSEHPEGCAYTITPGPNLTVSGSGNAPNGSAFCLLSPMLMDGDPEGRSIVCEAQIGGARWSIMVATSDDGAKTHAAVGALAKLPLFELFAAQSGDAPAAAGILAGPATVERGEGGTITASIKTKPGTIVVEAIHTETAVRLLKRYTPPPKATCKLSAAKGSPPSRPTLSGSGFQSGELINISFDDVQLTQAKAATSGDFKKAITIPPAAAPGLHSVKAAGQKSLLVVTASFRVLPPAKKKPSS